MKLPLYSESLTYVLRELEESLCNQCLRIDLLEKKIQNLVHGNKKDTQPCNSLPKWKKWNGEQVNGVPVDDKTYLVSWKDSDGRYKGPYKAYYLRQDNKFFHIESIVIIAIDIDIFIELPEFPHD